MTIEEIHKKIKKLEEEKQRLLSHCVGMSYNMQEVFKINKEINKWQKLVRELNLKE